MANSSAAWNSSLNDALSAALNVTTLEIKKPAFAGFSFYADETQALLANCFRRWATLVARPRNTSTVSSQWMQASVTLWP
jgi:hypothetical protein